MGVPTSEVGYTFATTRRETAKVHKNIWWHWRGKNIHITKTLKVYCTYFESVFVTALTLFCNELQAYDVTKSGNKFVLPNAALFANIRKKCPHYLISQIFFFGSMPPLVLCGLRGPPSWAWQECNRLLRLGRP